ncbi:MAG: nucleotidyl transferase AbiEii/AbiGii toxin family protein [Ignavibacteriae bacterium]|nr:nucleotidyl transferase AbiEii/AbiGii toxin family protein [Ignavibacteriota bacterium]NOH00113.1 nucleotidyl transferase AbiEii/AbiGii toxin family protein [Ignavibacteriota bacterium]
MIKKHCFSEEWINGFRREKKYSKINPPILEKMINALSLLQHLVKNDLKFVFKGGTSLILLLDNSSRFSVDIDILTTQNRETIEPIFNKIIDNSHFAKWELDERRSYKSGIPKAHYEFQFNSIFSKKANSILLDIIFEEPKYPKVQTLPIKAKWIDTDEELSANIPTVESIVGDKLTAFAPNTTGILFGSGKELEIIKQLYDLGNLFEKIDDLEIVNKSFLIFANQEIEYRELNITPEDILDDILKTAKLISLREKNKSEDEKSQFKEIQMGIRGFANFLISGNFRIDDAINASARVAYLASRLKHKDFSPHETFTNQDISKINLTHPDWNYLNKLKKLPDKSGFFYWQKTIEILEQK